ncbi:MAG: hypothetical protein H8E32_14320 [Nitrospinae bacterium]|nr:hypothetical protein [Nitrospinota bacterium]
MAPDGKVRRKAYYSQAGKGCPRKRMLACNEPDSVIITQYENMPTSDRSEVVREFEESE